MGSRIAKLEPQQGSQKARLPTESAFGTSKGLDSLNALCFSAIFLSTTSIGLQASVSGKRDNMPHYQHHLTCSRDSERNVFGLLFLHKPKTLDSYLSDAPSLRWIIAEDFQSPGILSRGRRSVKPGAPPSTTLFLCRSQRHCHLSESPHARLGKMRHFRGLLSTISSLNGIAHSCNTPVESSQGLVTF
jgi:hypothetical protein